MNTPPSILADIVFQAAVAVGHHAKSSPKSALYEGVMRVLGRSKESYQAWTDVQNLYSWFYRLHVLSLNHKDFHCDGPPWQMWLTNQGRAEMVMNLLFVYEHIVTELSGDRVELPSFVTPRNDDQTVVHS